LSGCAPASSTKKRVIVLGLDGLDPGIVRALIRAGRAPSFRRLAEMGSFLPLRTTMPALSPVAWASFITGTTPGRHGITDFITRDPETYLPEFSIFANEEPSCVLDFGEVHLPLSGGGPHCLRHGTPFWSYLTERDIPAWLLKLPTNYPVDETATRAISGIGTPDLTGAYGTFSYYTSNTLELFPGLDGGVVHFLEPENGTVRAELLGPENTLRTPAENDRRRHAGSTRVPFTVYMDPARDAVRIDIQGQTVVLNRGEYSDWVSVEFTLLPLLQSVSGIVRFLLQEVRPYLRLYATPVNIDPARQAAPVTYPASFGEEIARGIGSFWTKGLPCDTKALDYGVISDEEYVGQAELVLRERLALFDHLWPEFDTGLFYFYVSSTDQDAHMLWRNMDERHPRHAEADPRYSDYLHYLYEEMDGLVGRILPAADEDTLLIVCSDHGFAPFYRQFHLNTWLRERGYLAVKDGARRKEEPTLFDIDWSRTVAYGLGFNGLYLNLKGREGQGIVEPARAGELASRLRRELEALRDPETGERPVARVYTREELEPGGETTGMAELLVGYSPGYRNSAQSFLGSSGREIIDLNPWAWSGDHSMARDLVPGTFLSNRPVPGGRADMLDLPVTILDFFGVPPPGQMTGRSLLRPPRS
jgi:predicted AlkP superfamily phosphohydrolase/phosphomutase